MVQVARGKALVAKLRADPGVRDAEALAAYLGRKKKLKLAAKKAKNKGKNLAKNNKSSDTSTLPDILPETEFERGQRIRRQQIKKAADFVQNLPVGSKKVYNGCLVRKIREPITSHDRFLKVMRPGNKPVIASLVEARKYLAGFST